MPPRDGDGVGDRDTDREMRTKSKSQGEKVKETVTENPARPRFHLQHSVGETESRLFAGVEDQRKQKVILHFNKFSAVQ